MIVTVWILLKINVGFMLSDQKHPEAFMMMKYGTIDIKQMT